MVGSSKKYVWERFGTVEGLREGKIMKNWGMTKGMPSLLIASYRECQKNREYPFYL